MRVLTQITAHLGHPPLEELERLEMEDKHPRVLLFERSLNSMMMDERILESTSGFRRLLYRGLPINLAQALDTFRRRYQYDAVISWAENLGLPFAFMLKVSGAWVSHVGIFSWISRPKKAFFFRILHQYFDRLILMSSRQRDFAVNDLKIPPWKVVRLNWPVDQRFWRPMDSPNGQSMICAVGREMRDYGTLIEALKPLGIRCHIAAGGITSNKSDPWRSVLKDVASLPSFITVGKMPFLELRSLYARSSFVVVPLLPTDTDNGTTTILEAMAMGKAVICSRVEGQKDVIEDGVNGILVSPQDPSALREAIQFLWNNPEEAARMGRAGREKVERDHAFDRFVSEVQRTVSQVVSERVESSSHFSYPRSEQRPYRFISIVTKGSNRPERPQLRRYEQEDLHPRVFLFEDEINTATLNEFYLRCVPYYRRWVYRLLPMPLWQSIEALVIRERFDGIITWSARNVILLALVQKLTGRRTPHVALMSWFSKPKVAFLLRKVLSHIDHIVVWSSIQYRFAVEQLGVPREKITLVSRRVDHHFWRPMDVPTDTICSVGQEMRDYPTLVEALRGLDIPCHIATGALRGELYDTVRALEKVGPLPANISTGKLNFVELRALYARSRFVVIPLLPTDTDNGVTVIEEAMAMGKTVVCSRTEGQVDMIRDGETGIFVPQGDPVALRSVIQRLWNHPEETERIGKAAREFIVQNHTLDRFVESVKKVSFRVVEEHAGKRT